MIRFIGDVHGKFNEFMPLIHPTATTIQVGDFGFGFGPIPELPKNLFILRGNHDSPSLMEQRTNTLNGSGIFYTNQKAIGYVAGAYSRDKEQRIEGVDWWADEELSYSNLTDAISFIKDARPDIIVTHDCPQFIYGHSSKTSAALNWLFEVSEPKFWVFGHHHRRYNEEIFGTRFIGLEELGVFDLE